MAEGARLESVYTATYRGFESPPHRHILRRARTQVRAFFSHVAPTGGMRTPDRGSTTGAASWTDRKPASGLPRRGERSESIPPSPPYFKKSSYASTGFFFRMWHRRHPRGRQQCLSRATRPYPPGSPAKRSAAGRMPKNNKARASPGLAHSMTINNRLSASAGRGPSARSHRW